MTRQTFELVVAPDGTGRCLYDEALDLSRLGEARVRRASRCEPDERGKWSADLSPVGGPTIGPFDRRSDALAAEVAWLRRHVLRLETTQATEGAT